MKKLLIVLAALLLVVTSCNDEDSIVTHDVIILSSPDDDGLIINSTPRTIKDVSTRIDMGWTGGASTRGFLSFDISDIVAPEGKTLVIEKAVLKVYEKNTNMLPFDGGDQTRVVEAYLIDYGTLDAADFDKAAIANCGVITNWGYSVLEEYPLNVTDAVSGFIEDNSDASKIQFRLQFTFNENITGPSTLDQAMWSIYSGEDQGNYNDYRPVIELKYHWE